MAKYVVGARPDIGGPVEQFEYEFAEPEYAHSSHMVEIMRDLDTKAYAFVRMDYIEQ